ncbi:MAG: hypothetical protein ACREEM_23900, partial [Blastocatellia bacterium]
FCMPGLGGRNDDQSPMTNDKSQMTNGKLKLPKNNCLTASLQPPIPFILSQTTRPGFLSASIY